MMRVRSISDPETLSGTILVPVRKDDRLPDTLDRLADAHGLSGAMVRQRITAEEKAVFPWPAPHDTFLLILGLGEDPDFGLLCEAFRTLAHQQREQLDKTVALDLRFLPEALPLGPVVEAAGNGLALGAYDIGRFRHGEDKVHPLDQPGAELVLLPGRSGEDLTAFAERGLTLADTQRRIFDLVNAPSNKKKPEDLAAWAAASGQRFGYAVKVLRGEALRDTGLHGLLAVNRGSEYPAVFIVMEYAPEAGAEDLPLVGLVGKGVTFDTGGLSIKASQNMHLMKSDMGGAAAVLGTLEAAARLKLPVRLTGIVPATDNCVDALSIKPGDVIDSYAGKSIEVIDTDAEGRLILADGLAYLRDRYDPEVMVDLATLTGSAVRALGYHAAALFSNSDDLAAALEQAGERSGERCWRMPLWKAYGEDLASDVADLRNLGRRPVAGAVFAAKFLESFTGEHPAWAHLDIAGVALRASPFAKDRSATAFGVRLLIDFLSHLPTLDLESPGTTGQEA